MIYNEVNLVNHNSGWRGLTMKFHQIRLKIIEKNIFVFFHIFNAHFFRIIQYENLLCSQLPDGREGIFIFFFSKTNHNFPLAYNFQIISLTNYLFSSIVTFSLINHFYVPHFSAVYYLWFLFIFFFMFLFPRFVYCHYKSFQQEINNDQKGENK